MKIGVDAEDSFVGQDKELSRRCRNDGSFVLEAGSGPGSSVVWYSRLE